MRIVQRLLLLAVFIVIPSIATAQVTPLTGATLIGAGGSMTCVKGTFRDPVASSAPVPDAVVCWAQPVAVEVGGLGGFGPLDDSDRTAQAAGNARRKLVMIDDGKGGLSPADHVDELALGGYHACLRRFGRVYCWGYNYEDELGYATPVEIDDGDRFVTSSYAPKVVGSERSLAGVAQIVAGELFTVARLGASQEVKAWGYNGFGNLGRGWSGSSQASVLNVIDASGQDLTGVVAIAAGNDHALALKSDGSVYAWGSNEFGSIGRGTFAQDEDGNDVLTGPDSCPDPDFDPTDDDERIDFACAKHAYQVPNIAHATMIAAGGDESMALIDTDGDTRADTLVVWGVDIRPNALSRLSYDLRDLIAQNGPIENLEASWPNRCVQFQNKAVFCSGGNAYGQLLRDYKTVPTTNPFIKVLDAPLAMALGDGRVCDLESSGAPLLQYRCAGLDGGMLHPLSTAGFSPSLYTMLTLDTSTGNFVTGSALQGSGSLTASPNPCVIPFGQTKCTMAISWDSNLIKPTVTVDVGGVQLTREDTFGTIDRQVTAAGMAVRLIQVRQYNPAVERASLFVRGAPAATLTPTPPLPTPTSALPPIAPADVSAAALSGSDILLTWTDRSSNEAGFRIRRAAGPGSYEEIAVVAANTTSYTNGGLDEYQTYDYEVVAFNGSGDSAPRSTSVTTLDVTAPSMPANLRVYTDSSSSGVNMEWDESTDGGSGLVEYTLEGSNWGVVTIPWFVSPPGVTLASGDLSVGQQYCFRVSARDVAGNASLRSNERCFAAGVAAEGSIALADSGLIYGRAGDTGIGSATVTITVDGTVRGTAEAGTGGNGFTFPAFSQLVDAYLGFHFAPKDYMSAGTHEVALTVHDTATSLDVPLAGSPLSITLTADDLQTRGSVYVFSRKFPAPDGSNASAFADPYGSTVDFSYQPTQQNYASRLFVAVNYGDSTIESVKLVKKALANNFVSDIRQCRSLAPMTSCSFLVSVKLRPKAKPGRDPEIAGQFQLQYKASPTIRKAYTRPIELRAAFVTP